MTIRNEIDGQADAAVTDAARPARESVAIDHNAPTPKEPPFISYAQNFEDVMLWRALGHLQNGFYIDIGAGEPEADSVSKAFYDRGWSGINIEPLELTFARLAAARPRDRNLSVLVGDTEGASDFFLIDGGNGLSTAVPELAARHAVSGWTTRAVALPVTTLKKICDQHVHGQIHFLKIDAEWSELAILRGADFVRYRPWIVLFESTPIASRPHSFEDCDRELEQAGYRFLYDDGLNRFWVAEERHMELAHHFAVPPNVFDNFVRASEVAAQALSAGARDELEKTAAELRDTRQRHDEAQAAATAAHDEARRAREETQRARDEQNLATAQLEEARRELARIEPLLAEQSQSTARYETQLSQISNKLAQINDDAAGLRTRLERMAAERDAYAQELFETNRYTGVLTATRQVLLERVAEAEAEQAAQAEGYAHARSVASAELADAKVQIRRLRERLDGVYASTSWKLSGPMRAAKRLLSGRRP